MGTSIPPPRIAEMRTALAEAIQLLDQHDRRCVADAQRDLDARLAKGDAQAVQRLLAEATGGSGSMRDQVFYGPGGEYLPIDNARYEALIETIAHNARAAMATPREGQ